MPSLLKRKNRDGARSESLVAVLIVENGAVEHLAGFDECFALDQAQLSAASIVLIDGLRDLWNRRENGVLSGDDEDDDQGVPIVFERI